MRWLVAGLLFSLAVGLAIGTAAIRANNVRARQRIERLHTSVEDRIVELRRLGLARIEAASPQRLAELHWQWLDAAAALREGQGQ